MHIEAIAPRAGDRDAIIGLLNRELRAGERLLDVVEPLQQRSAVRRHQADRAAQHPWLAGRQVELALADIDPHIGKAGVHIRVARQAKPGDVERRPEVLVGYLQVDVLKADDIAEVLGVAVVRLRLGAHGFLRRIGFSGV